MWQNKPKLGFPTNLIFHDEENAHTTVANLFKVPAYKPPAGTGPAFGGGKYTPPGPGPVPGLTVKKPVNLTSNLTDESVTKSLDTKKVSTVKPDKKYVKVSSVKPGHNCPVCGETLRRANQKYCSRPKTCRQTAYRERHDLP